MRVLDWQNHTTLVCVTEGMEKMYSFESRIRYSETDSDGNLSLEGLLDYFQDCSTFHSEDLGVGVEYLKENKMIWVLSSWQIEVERFPALAERVNIGTFPYDFKGCFGYRNFFLTDEQGKYLAKANTMWTLLDTERFRPVHPNELMLEKYVLEEKLDMDYAGRKIMLPKESEEQEPITVRKQHLDTNHHVNNVQYVRMAKAFLPEDFPIVKMRAEYKKQALLGDVLVPYAACSKEDSQEKWTVSLQDMQGGVFVNVEFEGRCK